MSQYTPQPGAKGPLARHVTGAEYRAAVAYMENCGITDGYTQAVSYTHLDVYKRQLSHGGKAG